MSTIIRRLRNRYKPATVKVLFVAESPPESTDDGEVRFFYNPRQERWDHMYRAVMTAVFPDFEYRPGEKDVWLRTFKEHGYYMIDATDSPINRRSPAERRRRLNAALKEKLREIEGLISPTTPIILVKKSVFLAFNGPLRDRGFNVIHESFLPFPSHGHQPRFIAECCDCLRRHKQCR
jgi:hypothetical protein